MRRTLTFAGLALVAALGALWALGALDGLGQWLAAAQRAAQDRLAGAIRSLRAGEAGALAGLWVLCFGYGVLHAAGPGHGKLVIGGYGLARRVPMLRLAGLALASALAQAAVAVALVYALVAVLGLARGAVLATAEDWLAPASQAMIAALGVWLVWRGVTGLRTPMLAQAASTAAPGAGAGPAFRPDHGPDHALDHGPRHSHAHRHDDGHHRIAVPGGQDAVAPCCHAHGPTLEQAARVTGWRDGLLLVAGIAARPCVGALFVLILTWQLGIGLAGVVGAVVMGLGTALVTVGVAVLAVWAREGFLTGVGSGRLARALPVLELTLGAVITLSALVLLARQA